MFLNVGSGQRKFGTPGAPWVNVDTNPKWTPDVVADAAHMPMFEDDSADVICLHHVLEHFRVMEATVMLKECNRILKIGGSLIVCVPNTRALSKAWLRGDLSDDLFFVNTYGAYMDHEADTHKWGYTEQTLNAFIDSAALWSEVKPFDWRVIPGGDIAKDWWIMGAEAVK